MNMSSLSSMLLFVYTAYLSIHLYVISLKGGGQSTLSHFVSIIWLPIILSCVWLICMFYNFIYNVGDVYCFTNVEIPEIKEKKIPDDQLFDLIDESKFLAGNGMFYSTADPSDKYIMNPINDENLKRLKLMFSLNLLYLKRSRCAICEYPWFRNDYLFTEDYTSELLLKEVFFYKVNDSKFMYETSLNIYNCFKNAVSIILSIFIQIAIIKPGGQAKDFWTDFIGNMFIWIPLIAFTAMINYSYYMLDAKDILKISNLLIYLKMHDKPCWKGSKYFIEKTYEKIGLWPGTLAKFRELSHRPSLVAEAIVVEDILEFPVLNGSWRSVQHCLDPEENKQLDSNLIKFYSLNFKGIIGFKFDQFHIDMMLNLNEHLNFTWETIEDLLSFGEAILGDAFYEKDIFTYISAKACKFKPKCIANKCWKKFLSAISDVRVGANLPPIKNISKVIINDTIKANQKAIKLGLSGLQAKINGLDDDNFMSYKESEIVKDLQNDVNEDTIPDIREPVSELKSLCDNFEVSVPKFKLYKILNMHTEQEKETAKHRANLYTEGVDSKSDVKYSMKYKSILDKYEAKEKNIEELVNDGFILFNKEIHGDGKLVDIVRAAADKIIDRSYEISSIVKRKVFEKQEYLLKNDKVMCTLRNGLMTELDRHFHKTHIVDLAIKRAFKLVITEKTSNKRLKMQKREEYLRNKFSDENFFKPSVVKAKEKTHVHRAIGRCGFFMNHEINKKMLLNFSPKFENFNHRVKRYRRVIKLSEHNKSDQRINEKSKLGKRIKKSEISRMSKTLLKKTFVKPKTNSKNAPEKTNYLLGLSFKAFKLKFKGDESKLAKLDEFITLYGSINSIMSELKYKNSRTSTVKHEKGSIPGMSDYCFIKVV